MFFSQSLLEIKIIESKLFKILFLVIIFKFGKESFYFKSKGRNNLKKINNIESNVRIFIMTHKDFKNVRTNPSYVITIDDKSNLKNKYNLDIIDSIDGELFNKSRGYGEMSKLYFIFQLYRKGTISSKYIGLNHYKRYFEFGDDIPDLDNIFQKYDVILNELTELPLGIRKYYCKRHICKNIDEVIKIIKDIKPSYYKTALKTINEDKMYICNMFIMKKEDFFKYCEFIYDILFEFDRRNNFTSDNDVLEYVKKLYDKPSLYYYQARMQGFLAERIGNIFFRKYFKRIKTYKMDIIRENTSPIQIIIDQQQAIYEKILNIWLFLKISFFLIIIILFFFFIILYNKLI